MNRIKTADISDPTIQQPFTGNSLDFIQDANKDMVLAMVLAMVGDNYDNTKAYVIKGVNAYGTHQYKEGWILYGGELYYTTGKSTTTAFVNVPVMTITISNDPTADPITFSDGISRNAHNIRTLVLSDAVSGTGDFDLSDAIYLQDGIAYTPTIAALDSGGTPVGGFSVVGVDCRYLLKDNMLIIDVSLTGITTGANSRTLTFTLPAAVSVISPRQLTGNSVVKYYDGVNHYAAIANIRLNYTGSGSGLTVERADYTDFATSAGGTCKFTLVAFML